MVGRGKNCKGLVFRRMLLLKVSKTIIQETFSMLLGWVPRGSKLRWREDMGGKLPNQQTMLNTRLT